MVRTLWRAEAHTAARGHFGGFLKKSFFDASIVEKMSWLNQNLSFIKPQDFEKYVSCASYFDLMHFGPIERILSPKMLKRTPLRLVLPGFGIQRFMFYF